jgi:hypothetical protein
MDGAPKLSFSRLLVHPGAKRHGGYGRHERVAAMARPRAAARAHNTILRETIQKEEDLLATIGEKIGFLM